MLGSVYVILIILTREMSTWASRVVGFFRQQSVASPVVTFSHAGRQLQNTPLSESCQFTCMSYCNHQVCHRWRFLTNDVGLWKDKIAALGKPVNCFILVVGLKVQFLVTALHL